MAELPKLSWRQTPRPIYCSTSAVSRCKLSPLRDGSFVPDFFSKLSEENSGPINPLSLFWSCLFQPKDFSFDPSNWKFDSFRRSPQIQANRFWHFCGFPSQKLTLRLAPLYAQSQTFNQRTEILLSVFFSLTWWIKDCWLKKIFQLFYQKLLYNFYHEIACKRTSYPPILKHYPPKVCIRIAYTFQRLHSWILCALILI